MSVDAMQARFLSQETLIVRGRWEVSDCACGVLFRQDGRQGFDQGVAGVVRYGRLRVVGEIIDYSLFFLLSRLRMLITSPLRSPKLSAVCFVDAGDGGKAPNRRRRVPMHGE